MLAEIYVENFALIEHLQIEFHEGLNIITGQTGAGKSLLTDAVGLLLGGKSDKDLIRQGTGKALVEGIFSGPFSAAVQEFCGENGVTGDTIVISREMSSEGKNTVRLNGRRITLSLLEELTPLLMNIHSQTEHFSLFKEEAQLQLLDSFGGEPIVAQKEKVGEAFLFWQEQKSALTELKNKVSDRERRLDYLCYQQKEIQGFHLMPGEEETVREAIALLASSVSRYEEAQLVYASLRGDENGSVIDGLYQAMNAAVRIAEKDPVLEKAASTLQELYYTVEDITEEVLSYRDGIEIDPRRLEDLENRLSEIRKAEKKYNRDVEGILSYLQEIEAEIAALTGADVYMEHAEREEAEAYQSFFSAAAELTTLREQTGKGLADAIEKELKELMLPDARFDVVLRDAPVSAQGKDSVTFMATMNKGEDLRPLAKVASGGEISRVLLGAKIILADLDAIGTMIFDEIDSGLGGETAARVGEKLKLLGKGMQVFAVTHSPLVAVYADHHYYIEKKEENGRVSVHLKTLSNKDIRHEIARMLSGDGNSAVSLNQADALLKAAGND
ncbi:MAG TPA: DNA repair protein RecN [Clostridiales bacterium]|nr:DNA repair protein RecN [Clostridiales bacterium]